MRKTIFAIAAVVAFGTPLLGTATARPHDRYFDSAGDPAVTRESPLRQPRPGDSACWVRARIWTPVGVRWRFIATC